MAFISETSDDGSNGGDPTKNLQEEKEDNQNENPQEEVENLPIPQEEEEIHNDNPQEVEENLPIPQELPIDLIVSIVALIPRFHYPSLSLVSRAFRQVITSHELYLTRSSLGFTEPVLYAFIGFPPYIPPSWFFLRRSNLGFPLQLRIIRSLPPMFPAAAVVTIGYKIYLMGGYNHLVEYRPVSTVVVIDCRFHTWGYLQNMRRARYHAAAGVIDGNIYVIGGCKKRDDDWVEVFNVTTETWATVPSQCPEDASENGEFITYVVMQGRIFILELGGCFAYEPRQGLWQSWGVLSELMRFWHSSSSCVIGDLLYTLDLTCSRGHPIVVYYPNELVWRPVQGVYSYNLPILRYNWSKMANFGGKLVILSGGYSLWFKDIWCIEIALETRQGNQIWGVVESISLVFRDVMMAPSIELCRTVTF
ncbi:Kelch repeat type 1 [Arabidopsis thaliana x Arabidopsis arenosa]|uniref:Kelch repeat type 1 n=1 Tax=Arabidopsis thaliana x Arabidopsis arenosa TaxID=1240361 RepID=A0A8T2A7V3_9BRAS|nr:Kelch repeat type 1 [Arabidopsis thaliana x Arabidopsis arenosa]